MTAAERRLRTKRPLRTKPWYLGLFAAFTSAFLATVVALVAGCGTDEPGPQQAPTKSAQRLILETDTRGEIAAAGVPFTLDCRAFWTTSPASSDDTEVNPALGAEASLPGAATLVVTDGPVGPAAIDGLKVTFAVPGNYKVACSVPAVALMDETPATLIAETGAPTTPRTEVRSHPAGELTTEVAAGDHVVVSCSGTDVMGNAVTEGWAVVTAPAALQADVGVALQLTAAGDVSFACKAGNRTDTTPAKVKVTVGQPRHLWTKLTPVSVVAGQAAEVQCKATDPHGNAVANFPFSISHSAKVTLKKLYLTTTFAGQHSVKCVPESIPWAFFEIHGALLTVKPAPPAALHIARVPEKGVYKRESKVKFVPYVRDKFGNTVDGWPVTMAVTKPAKGYKILANKPGDMHVRFNLDATYELEFTASGTALATKIAVLVDGAPPLLAIDYPEWGSTVTLKPSIQLKGKAGDKGAGIKDLFINGIKTFADAADDWFLQVGAKHGLNMVEAVATDLGDQKSRATRGFYYSDKYYATDASNPKAHRVAAALQVFLSQDFFDDGVHDHTKPDDVATLIEIIAGSISLSQLAPNAMSGAGADVSLSNFKMAKPKVQITTHEGGLEVRIVLSGITVDVAVKAKLKLGPLKTTLKANGTLTVASIDVGSWLKLGVQKGKVTASAAWTKAKIDGMKLSVSGLAGLFDPIFNLILNGIKGDIEKGLEAELSKELPEAFAAIFSALAINDTFEIDPLVPGAKGKVTMVMASEVASIELKKVGMIAKIDMGMSSAKKVPHSNLGAIARAGCVGVAPDKFHIDTNARIQVAAHDDLINQMLHALWYGGALSGVIEKGTLVGQGVPAIPLQTATVTIDPLLPPIIEGCPNAKNPGDPLLIRLQMGDAQASIDVYSNKLVRLDVVMHLDAPIALKLGKDSAGQTALIATADPNPTVLHELHGLSKQLQDSKWAWIKATDTLFGDLFAKGLPGLDKPIVVPLPNTEIDLAAVVPGVAPGTKMTVVVQKMTRKGGYGAFTMALQ
jgi:hypothetical protein